MSEWLGDMTAALAEEFAGGPQVCTLATVDKSGAPRARSVVCRKISPDGSITIVSDARSEKNEHAKVVPQGEIVFWLPTRREQYRVLGSLKVINADNKDPARLDVWKQLSDASRAMFFWPSPGAKRVEKPEAFSQSVDAGTAPPGQFELLVLRPRRVEHLQLATHPHRRRRWMLAGNWSAGSEVNP